MNKNEQTSLISLILNQGPQKKNESKAFQAYKHEQLLEEFITFLKEYKLLNDLNPKILTLQGLNDNGVDMILETNEMKIGFQIKSEFDVNEKDFAVKVKSQLADSATHGIDKWYLIICCDLSNKSNESKVAYIVSQISMYVSNYAIVFSPNITINYFNKKHKTNEVLNLIFKGFRYDNNDIKTILLEIKDIILNQPQKTSKKTIASIKINGVCSKNLIKLKKFYKWDLDQSQLDATNTDFITFYNVLKRIPENTRILYAETFQRSGYNKHTHNYYANPLEIKEILGETLETVNKHISILSRYSLAYIDAEDDIIVIKEQFGWDFLHTIKKFFDKNKIEYSNFFKNLDFSIFDE